MTKNAKRNNAVDVIRGLAILMVIAGHTLTGSTSAYDKSPLNNIIWSLQMPLFMLISGYITKFSKPVDSGKSYLKFIQKRTLTYILPWVVWSFGISGVIFNKNGTLNIFERIQYLIWNLDTGYWFLFVLWVICMIFGTAQFISGKLFKNIQKPIVVSLFSVLLSLPLLVIAKFAGISFLGIKLILYYLPFFFLGYLFGAFGDKMGQMKRYNLLRDVVIGLAVIGYIIIMSKYNIFLLGESVKEILIRISASISGCVLVISFACFSMNIVGEKVKRFFAWCGIHSLEFYLVHYGCLSIIKISPSPLSGSYQGIALFFANYILTFVLSALIVNILNHNPLTNFLLFGKVPVKKNKEIPLS